MARITSIATSALTRHLNGDQGVPDEVEQLIMAGDVSLTPLSAADILERHVTAEIAEKTSGVRYPVVYVYCEKVKNDLRGSLQKYVEAVTDVLHKKRGQWTTAVFYTGGYEIQYGPIKRGGKNFVQ